MSRKRAAESDSERDGTPPVAKRPRVSSPNRDQQKRYEEDFERLHTKKVQESLNQRMLKNNGAAEAGIITYIELHNFMCHKFLSFNFGPQVNFIIGNNGSGKSAALSAITIALGGKATSTGRGSGLKSFIKSGESQSEVTVKIKNGGGEPYRREVYGDHIQVTRNFSQTGSSSYKIKDSKGKNVSTTREELQAILDHFSIDVDNPMNILTQDLARQFLSASGGSEKYQLFAKGTLLTQLQEEYDIIQENCTKTASVLQHKREVIDELGQSYSDAENRYKQAESLQEAESNISNIKVELAWAHVAEKATQFEKAVEETASCKSRLQKLEKKVEEAQRTVAEAEERLHGVQAQATQAVAPRDLQEQFNNVQQEIKSGKEELRKSKRDTKEIAEEIKNKKSQMALVQASIDEANAMQAMDEKREQIRQNIERAKVAHEQAKQKHEQLTIDRIRAKEAVDTYQKEANTVNGRYDALQRRIADTEGRISDLQGMVSGKDGAAIYGRNMPRVLQEIGRATWRDRKPVGPLGMHVKLRDQHWAPALRVGLGGALGSFAVTNNQDRATLRTILDNAGFYRTAVIVTQVDMFDYSAGEPPQGLMTVLRALEIDDPWVIRLLINGNVRIERTILARTRADAERIAAEDTRFTVWTAEGLRIQKFSDGGGQTASLGKIGGGDYRNNLFMDNREQEELDRNKIELQRLNQEYTNIYEERKSLEESLRTANNDLRTATRSEKEWQAKAKQSYDAWKDAETEHVEEKSVDLAALEFQLEEIQQEIKEKEGQVTAAVQVTERIRADLQPLAARSESLRLQLGNFDTRQQELRLEVQEATSDHLQAKRSEDHYTEKWKQECKEYERKEDVQSVLEQEYKQWSEQLAAKHEVNENPRSVKALTKLLKAQEDAFNKRQAEQGKSFEELAVDLERAKEAFDKAKNDFNAMDNLVRSLRHSLAVRMQRWQHFRSHIALRCKLQFQLHLSQRGYHGSVVFDHKEHTLALKVQTDDQRDGTGKSREKDAKMSGGEKSFSTICLLLSLWDAMGCPIRALDEFDVYMDAVNRKISMKMMLDSAKNSDKQHILITPQDMGNVSLGPEIRIHRMRDPERGQQVLAF